MSLIDQANDQKHVWKTLDILCEIIERRETSQAEHTRLGTIDGSNKGREYIRLHSNKVLYPSELEEAALRNGKELDALLLTLQSSAGSDKKLSESSGGHRRNGYDEESLHNSELVRSFRLDIDQTSHVESKSSDNSPTNSSSDVDKVAKSISLLQRLNTLLSEALS